MRFVTGAPETVEEVTAFLERTRTYAQRQPQTQYRFAVVLTANELVIGGSGLDITDRDSHEGEIGYHLHREFWGQGVGTEVAIELLRFVFEDLKRSLDITAYCAKD